MTPRTTSGAPITAKRRPRPSKCQRHSFGTNGCAVGAPSCADGAGIAACRTLGHKETP